VVLQALEAGFFVRATARSEKSAKGLKELPGAKERLTVYTGCDLLEPGTFDDAIKGCGTVIHTASPFFWTNEEDKLVKPAVDGTKAVLEACARLGVKKVVLTSSVGAIYFQYGKNGPDHVFSEKDWTDIETCRRNKNFYPVSKMLAEKAAWEIAQKEGCPFKLAVMNPTLIMGSHVKGQTKLNTSHATILKLFEGGSKQYSQACMHLVDVDDVARAHINAAKMPLDWQGWGERFLLFGASASPKQVIETLKSSDKVPDEMKAMLPTEPNPELPPAVMGAPAPHITRYDASRSTSLVTKETPKGLALKQYVPLKEMLEKTVQSLIDNGFTSLGQYTLA